MSKKLRTRLEEKAKTSLSQQDQFLSRSGVPEDKGTPSNLVASRVVIDTVVGKGLETIDSIHPYGNRKSE